jgi:hypothetical protein
VYRLADSEKGLCCLKINADAFVAELGLVELKARAFEASVPPSLE